MTPVDQQYLAGNAEGIPGDCVRACVASILDLALADVPHFVAANDAYWAGALDDWCDNRGIELIHLEGHFAFNFPVMLSGASPRSGRHAVVGQGGGVLHDPHPSRDGLVGLADRTWLFYPARMNWREYAG
ncbi:MAG: hypothetical protein JNK47_12780 [Mesorhizobium sp.]|nr:hypothetical protein [Mesorhizobium sp.]MBL8578095.1 hypothetical protein [Mesorhizobium sp.]